MSFLALHRDKKHKYKNGLWTWQSPYDDDQLDVIKLKFNAHTNEKGNSADKKDDLHDDDFTLVGLTFADYIDEAEEKIFREVFMRPSSLYDGDVITIQDVKNLSLFIIKSTTTCDLIEFLHTSEFDEFLHAAIFYMDFFLLVLEFLLIRRDETNLEGKVRDTLSMRVERFLSKQLSDRRLLMAREYAKMLEKRRRMRRKLTAEKDLMFYECLIDFSIQCTFIAMHRRAFNAICEFSLESFQKFSHVFVPSM